MQTSAIVVNKSPRRCGRVATPQSERTLFFVSIRSEKTCRKRFANTHTHTNAECFCFYFLFLCVRHLSRASAMLGMLSACISFLLYSLVLRFIIFRARRVILKDSAGVASKLTAFWAELLGMYFQKGLICVEFGAVRAFLVRTHTHTR